MYASEVSNVARGAIEAFKLAKQAATSSAAQNALLKVAKEESPGAADEFATSLHSSAEKLAKALPAAQGAQTVTNAMQAGLKTIRAIRQSAWHLVDGLTTPDQTKRLPLAGKTMEEAVTAISEVSKLKPNAKQ